jgi:branched-chain amino acid transport system substrate-binding protein
MKIYYVLLILFVCLTLIFSGCITSGLFNLNENKTIKIGFIGAMTGPLAKAGSYEATKMAIDEINSNNLIKGLKLELIAEDGKCNALDAISAINKLIFQDNVKIIIGGHCTPESLAIAPIAEKNNVLMLASITSTPKLTDQGDYIFRLSPVSTLQVSLLIDLAKKRSYKTVSIIAEQTDYAIPIADKLNNDFKTFGEVTMYEKYLPGTQDFKTLVTKILDSNSDFVFISAQSPDAAYTIIKQLREHNKNVVIFGNDAIGNTGLIAKQLKLYEGIVYGTIIYDVNSKLTKNFIENYRLNYSVGVPYGVWTAESYDAVYVIADAIAKNGNDIEKIKQYLYNLKDFEGASGKISIDSNGDGIREYQLKIITSTGIEDLT